MSVSFRSLFQVDFAFEAVLEKFIELFVAETQKSIGDLLIDLSLVDFKSSMVLSISPDLEIVITRTPSSDSLQSYRARIAEIKDKSRWVTQYSIHQAITSSKECSLVVEINSPLHPYSKQPMWPQIPELLKNILNELEPTDLGIPLIGKQNHGQLVDASEIYSYLEDSKRRASLIVAVNPGLDNLDEYIGLIKELMKETGGTATAAILDSKTADLFNNLVSEQYSISRDYLRVFNPQLNFSENYQAHKHRRFPLSDLDEKGIDRVVKDVANLTRGNARKRSFPLSIQKRESFMNSLEQSVLGHGKRINPNYNSSEIQKSNSNQLSVINPEFSLDVISNAISEFREIIGKVFIDPLELVDLALGKKRLVSLELELIKLNEERDNLILESMELREDLDDEVLGRLEVFEQKSKLEAEIRFLRESLVNSRSAELAYELMPEGQYEPIPLTFQSVLNRFDELAFVSFTGDSSETLRLDDIDTGSSAPHCWEYLQVLDDYARAKVMNAFDNNFMQYLKNTPLGFKSMSFHKYAPVESEQTANRRSLLEARTFNVPDQVDPSGRAIMEAHLKLSRRIRIHFLDDTRKSGRVYVGFIGYHLPLFN